MEKKNAIITGASRGIGRAIAHALARNGYNLLINCSRSHEELATVKKELSDLYSIKCVSYIGNVGNPSCAKELFQTAKAELGDISLLINNAGISHVGLLQDMSYEEWDNILNVNLTSVFNMCKQVIPDMVSRKKGNIINISSVWGLCGASCETAYSATKGAINAFTKALGKELAPSHVCVNAIACGAVDTSMNSCFTDEELSSLCTEIPAGRMASAEEVAELVLTLVNAPSYLTGEIIKMDGGWI